jgi:hypothetical protein
MRTRRWHVAVVNVSGVGVLGSRERYAISLLSKMFVRRGRGVWSIIVATRARKDDV